MIGYLGLEDTGISPAVTPYHLLTHTSGIADDADEEAGERYEDLFLERPNYSVMETADYLPQFVGKPPNFAPGEGCRYCNVGYVLLGLMIERATGSTYRDYVAEHVFARAGMNRSGFFRMDVVEPDVAEGVEPIEDDDGGIVGWRRNIYSYPPVGGPDGGAHVTVGDLLRFHRAVADGRLLGPALTAELLSPKARHGARGAGSHLMGFGFEFETDADGGRALLLEGRRQRRSQRHAPPLPGRRTSPSPCWPSARTLRGARSRPSTKPSGTSDSKLTWRRVRPRV